MKNKIVLIIVAVLLLSFVWKKDSFTSKFNQPTPTPTQTLEQKEVTVTFVFSEDKKQEYKYSFSETKTAFDALDAVAKKEGLALETQQYDFGVFVKSIAEYPSSADMAWIFYVNGKSSDVGADKYELQNGDATEWKYVKPI